MIKNKQQALAFLHNKNNETLGKHRWHNHATFKTWIDEMLDEIFIEQKEDSANILQKKFGIKTAQALGLLCLGTAIEIDTLADFVKYRNEIKKPLKTSRPLKQYIGELIAIYDAGYTVLKAIELMKNNEWQTIKLEWVQKQLKSTKPTQSTDLKEFGF